jgi:hypothetical protein
MKTFRRLDMCVNADYVGGARSMQPCNGAMIESDLDVDTSAHRDMA